MLRNHRCDDIGYAIAQSLVLEIGGEPVRVREENRALYHAALAHGSNHLVTLVVDASRPCERRCKVTSCSVNSWSTEIRVEWPSVSCSRCCRQPWTTRYDAVPRR